MDEKTNEAGKVQDHVQHAQATTKAETRRELILTLKEEVVRQRKEKEGARQSKRYYESRVQEVSGAIKVLEGLIAAQEAAQAGEATQS